MTSKNILILLNDTDPLFARVCRNKFTKETGWDAAITESYQDALDLFNTRKPDIVLTSVILGEGKTGFDLISEVRGMGYKKEDVPIVIFSDLGQDSDKEKAMELGASKYFVKSEMMITDVIKELSDLIS